MEIDSLIDRFNKGWTQGDLSEVAAVLHSDVVFVAPDWETQVEGKEACLQTIKEYSENAKTHAFEVLLKEVRSWDQTAVVVITYHVRYELNEVDYHEKGKEFWTLARHDQRWQLVWRAMVKNEPLS